MKMAGVHVFTESGVALVATAPDGAWPWFCKQHHSQVTLGVLVFPLGVWEAAPGAGACAVVL